jgi:PIN domain nuclease of toxin-antitoxin system
MARKPRAIVLDSWAIISYLGGERSAEKVADIMADAHEEDIPLLMTVVNAGEVWYILAREVSVAEADSSIRQLRQLGIKLVDADWDLAHAAAVIDRGSRIQTSSDADNNQLAQLTIFMFAKALVSRWPSWQPV